MSESSIEPEPQDQAAEPALEPGGRPSWIGYELEHSDMDGDNFAGENDT